MIGVKDKELIRNLNIGDALFSKIIKLFDDMLRLPITKNSRTIGKFIFLTVDNIDHAK